VRQLCEALEQIRRDIEQAERGYDLNRAAELRHGRMPTLQQRLAAEEVRTAGESGGHRLLREEVTAGEIKQIIDLLVGELRQRLANRNIQIELSESAQERIARQGFEPLYRARPLQRFLQHALETQIDLSCSISSYRLCTVHSLKGIVEVFRDGGMKLARSCYFQKERSWCEKDHRHHRPVLGRGAGPGPTDSG
jgi:hypothetical protein